VESYQHPPAPRMPIWLTGRPVSAAAAQTGPHLGTAPAPAHRHNGDNAGWQAEFRNPEPQTANLRRLSINSNHIPDGTITAGTSNSTNGLTLLSAPCSTAC